MLPKKNKIYIPFARYNKIGGPTTFMDNLKNYLDKNNYSYKSWPFRIKSIFFPISYNISHLGKIKKQEGRIIQRLDGIYYQSQHGDSYVLQNQKIKQIYQNLADYVIFQSNYSRKQCFAMMGEKNKSEYEIIINGADKSIFYPKKELENNISKFIFVTTGSFRKKVMLEPIILALDRLVNKVNFELKVIGPIKLPELNKYLARDYVNYLGPKNRDEIADILRQSHIFIHTQLNDNCPNAVLEAISCGLPVVSFNSGAMSELCYFATDLLAEVNDEIFQCAEDFEYQKLGKKIELAVNNYQGYKTIAMQNAHLYSFAECGKNYVNVFNKFL